jgi:hypothetical protein
MHHPDQLPAVGNQSGTAGSDASVGVLQDEAEDAALPALAVVGAEKSVCRARGVLALDAR